MKLTDLLADLRRADAHARWRTADSLALRPEAAAQLAEAPVLLAGYMDDGEEEPGYEIEDGVAIVEIEGALMDRACWWWDGYDAIAERIEAAHADPAVRAVMLDISSPGGMVAGLFDAMRAMRAARVASGKRMVAWVGSGAFSAAYGLASTCDEIVTSDTGGTGSVGVIASLTSLAKMYEENGIDVRVVSSGVEKTDGHPAVPVSKGAEARLRARVEELAGMLFAEVGVGRAALTPTILTALDGGVRFGRAAVADGLADRISTRNTLLAELQSAVAPARSMTTPMWVPTGASRATRQSTMNEETIAAVTALTGESDPDGAVRSMMAQHAKLTADLAAAQSTISALSTDLASERARVAEMGARVEKIERDAEITAAKSSGQWSASLEPFLTSLSVEQLRTWRASAPAVVPQGEVKPPSEEPRADHQLPSELASTIAKATKDGWNALSAKEKHAVSAHDKNLAATLRAR